jgi:hypothetical protein
MNRSLALLAATVVALGAALAACSSAPDTEGTESTQSQQLVVRHCPFGETTSCKGSVCTCVPLGTTGGSSGSGTFTIPPQCSPLPPTVGDQMEVAWAVVPRDGACQPIPGTYGTWAQVGTIPPGFSELPGGEGNVPNDPNAATPNCADAFPASSYPTCCTYVWWPAGYGTTSSGQSMQDNSAVCTSNTAEEESLGQVRLVDCPDGGSCKKGGDDCPTCGAVQ